MCPLTKLGSSSTKQSSVAMLTESNIATLTTGNLCAERVSDISGRHSYEVEPAGGRVFGHRKIEGNIRTIITGSKEAHQNDLRFFLESQPDITLIAESENSDVMSVIGKYDPDLLVLDIRMSDANSFLSKKTPWEDDKPFVLIVAADNRYATQALQLHAVDFLVEPFDSVRIGNAVEKVRIEIRKTQYIRLAEKVIELLQRARRQDPADRLVFRSNGRIVFLEWDEIDWIEAMANYVRIISGTESYLMRESIGRLSGRVDRQCFIRIHRSIIVNVSRIKELQPVNSGEYIAILKNGKKLSCSRGFRGELDRFVAKCR